MKFIGGFQERESHFKDFREIIRRICFAAMIAGAVIAATCVFFFDFRPYGFDFNYAGGRIRLLGIVGMVTIVVLLFVTAIRGGDLTTPQALRLAIAYDISLRKYRIPNRQVRRFESSFLLLHILSLGVGG